MSSTIAIRWHSSPCPMSRGDLSYTPEQLNVRYAANQLHSQARGPATFRTMWKQCLLSAVYSRCCVAAPPVAHATVAATRGMHRMRMPLGPGCSVMAMVSSAAMAAAPPACKAAVLVSHTRHACACACSLPFSL